MDISQLNEDCKLQVINFLQLEDIILMGYLSESFYPIAARLITKIEVGTKEIEAIFTRLKPRQFFSKYGAEIKRLQFDPYYGKSGGWFKYLPKYCLNLEHLELRYLRINNISRYAFLGKLQTLNSLKIWEYCYLTDLISKQIGKLKNLNALCIAEERISGEYLSGLTTLTELDLRDCTEVMTTYFIEILQANLNLRRVNVSGCLSLCAEAFRSLVRTQPKLESLAFDSEILTSYNFLVDLRPLKEVSVCLTGVRDMLFNVQIFRDLSEYHASKLEKLTYSRSTNISFPKNVSFPNLREIYFFGGGGTEDLLGNVAEACDRLEKFTLSGWVQPVAEETLLAFLRQMEHLAYIDVPLIDFTVHTYERIIEIRKGFENSKPLTLVVYKKDLLTAEKLIADSSDRDNKRGRYLKITVL